eukprot:scaffold4999_cov101-Isochrysis_galbana.AAC.1
MDIHRLSGERRPHLPRRVSHPQFEIPRFRATATASTLHTSHPSPRLHDDAHSYEQCPHPPFPYPPPPRSRQIEWFRERGFADVPGLITNNPSLLSMPIEARLLPTLDLLLGPLGRSIGEIERFPRIFNYSIEMLSLRHDFLAEAGKTRRHGLTRTYRASPYTFATKLAGRSTHEWEAFLRQRARHRAGSPRAADMFFARQAAATAKDEVRRAAVQTERERVAKLLEQHAKAGAMEPADAVEAVSRMLRPRATPEHMLPAPATAASAAAGVAEPTAGQ